MQCPFVGTEHTWSLRLWPTPTKGQRTLQVILAFWCLMYGLTHVEFFRFYRAALNAGRSNQEKTVCPSVHLSVRLSDKRVDCDQTEER